MAQRVACFQVGGQRPCPHAGTVEREHELDPRQLMPRLLLRLSRPIGLNLDWRDASNLYR
jgi:hypothetical protein